MNVKVLTYKENQVEPFKNKSRNPNIKHTKELLTLVRTKKRTKKVKCVEVLMCNRGKNGKYLNFNYSTANPNVCNLIIVDFKE